jgi:hypothetical protein
VDEASGELVATIQGASDVRALRRAAWDAETVLGRDAMLVTVLRTAADEVAVTGVRMR